MTRNVLILFTSLLWLVSTLAYAQKKLSIEECHNMAVNNYPLIKQYDLIATSEGYTLSNLAKNYLPQVSFNAQATYQSDVTKMPSGLSSMIGATGASVPFPQKDQYKATLDVNQLIWDGGSISAQRKITQMQSELEKEGVTLNLYNIKDRINQLYFGLLAIDEQIKLLNLVEIDMDNNMNLAVSMLENGVAMQSDVDQIAIELLNIEQRRTEHTSIRRAYLNTLGLFLNEALMDNIQLEVPHIDEVRKGMVTRPEMSMFRAKETLYDTQYNTLKSKNMPTLGLFAQGGYGRPGLNMLEDDFKFFAIGGIKLTWKFGNLYTLKNDKKLIKSNKELVNIERETFLFNTNIQLTQEEEELNKLKKLLSKDDEIIRLRNRVKLSSESKYKNGVYQTNELIRDINAENQAKQTKSLHEIQYLLSIYNYNYIQGR